jgi:hypothetical protein
MSREWQPGDVAMLTTPKGDRRAVHYTDGWEDFEGAWWDDTRNLPARPLVVIDPEDREQVERLARDHHASGHIAAWGAMHENTRAGLVDEMQAALREYADPKPPCGASLTLGKDAAMYRCAEAEGHKGPHADGTCTWTAKS